MFRTSPNRYRIPVASIREVSRNACSLRWCQCLQHPAETNAPGSCSLCAARGLPCGPYERAEDSQVYLARQEPRSPLPSCDPLSLFNPFSATGFSETAEDISNLTSGIQEPAAGISGSQDAGLANGEFGSQTSPTTVPGSVSASQEPTLPSATPAADSAAGLFNTYMTIVADEPVNAREHIALGQFSLTPNPNEGDPHATNEESSSSNQATLAP